MCIGFLTKFGGMRINRGDTPRVLKASRCVPEVDPDTRGQENPIRLSMDERIGIFHSKRICFLTTQHNVGTVFSGIGLSISLFF